MAFLSLSISQTRTGAVEDGLAAIPEVIEVHATTGDADLMAKVVARGTTSTASPTRSWKSTGSSGPARPFPCWNSCRPATTASWPALGAGIPPFRLIAGDARHKRAYFHFSQLSAKYPSNSLSCLFVTQHTRFLHDFTYRLRPRGAGSQQLPQRCLRRHGQRKRLLPGRRGKAGPPLLRRPP